MVAIWTTFTCTICGKEKKETNEVDVIDMMQKEGPSVAVTPCRGCKPKVEEHNKILEAQKRPPKPIPSMLTGGASKSQAKRIRTMKDAAQAKEPAAPPRVPEDALAAALLQIAAGQEKILEKLDALAPKPEAKPRAKPKRASR